MSSVAHCFHHPASTITTFAVQSHSACRVRGVSTPSERVIQGRWMPKSMCQIPSLPSLRDVKDADLLRSKQRSRLSLRSSLVPDLALWREKIMKDAARDRRNVVKKRHDAVVKGIFGIIEVIAATSLLIGGLISVSFAIGLVTLTTALGVFFLPLVGGIVLFTLTPLKLVLLGSIGTGLFYIFDKLASTFLIFNFGAVILSLAFKYLRKDDSKNYVSTSEIEISKPVVATFLTLVPGLGWLPWVWALLDSQKNLTFWRKIMLLKNSFVYGGASLLSVIFTGRLFDVPGNAWFLSQVLGITHFILLQKGFLDDLKEIDTASLEEKNRRARREAEEAEKRRAAERRAKMESSEAEELLRRRKELAEFDLKLRPNASRRANNPSLVSLWEVSDVLDWLQSENLSQHAVSIVQHDVDGRVLLQLTEDDLKQELGIVTLGERKRFMESLLSLKKRAGLL